MRASSTRDPIRLGRKPGIVRTSQRPLTAVRQVTNDGPRSWPAHTLPLALPAPDQGVTARPGGSAPVGGGPRHREVSSATQVAGSVRGTKPPNRCRARHRTRSAPPRPEPDPFAPAFARRKRTMAKACDHCAAHRCGLGEPRSDPPDRAGTGNVHPTGQGVKSPTRLDVPTRRQSRERPPPMGEPLGIPGAGAGSLSPHCMDGGDLFGTCPLWPCARSLAWHPGGGNPRELCPDGRNPDHGAPEPTGWPVIAGSRFPLRRRVVVAMGYGA